MAPKLVISGPCPGQPSSHVWPWPTVRSARRPKRASAARRTSCRGW